MSCFLKFFIQNTFYTEYSFMLKKPGEWRDDQENYEVTSPVSMYKVVN